MTQTVRKGMTLLGSVELNNHMVLSFWKMFSPHYPVTPFNPFGDDYQQYYKKSDKLYYHSCQLLQTVNQSYIRIDL